MWSLLDMFLCAVLPDKWREFYEQGKEDAQRVVTVYGLAILALVIGVAAGSVGYGLIGVAAVFVAFGTESRATLTSGYHPPVRFCFIPVAYIAIPLLLVGVIWSGIHLYNSPNAEETKKEERSISDRPAHLTKKQSPAEALKKYRKY